ncbi:basic secretory protein-like protein [Arachidicoccus ginsenosidimutans]|uniref:basic secretory protein-like protein n=1 Tax=Arachidicoccus sp. BS20 TaxID=1850526 RepID=UPI000B0D5597|nr:basic secretory protein-like protein [Arachidicoccus sp. BS20]
MKNCRILNIIFFTAFIIMSCKKSVAVVDNSGGNKKDSTVADTPPIDTTSVTGIHTYIQGGDTLIFLNNDPDFDTSMRTKYVNVFFIVYPEEAARFNPGTIKKVTFSVDTAYHDIAGTANGKVTFNPEYCRNNPNDVDVVTHEVMHIVQAYSGDGPGWLTEGIADYARYTYGVHNADIGWTVQPYSLTKDYTAGYGEAAHFLLWLEQNKNKQIVDILNNAMYHSIYAPSVWLTATGETLEELWADYGKNPALTEEKTPIGDATDLTVGSQISVTQENPDGYGSPESSFELNDNDIKSKFLLYGFQPGLSIRLKLKTPAVANAYVMTSGNDNPDRDPSNWLILASKDSANWTLLDGRPNESFAGRNTTNKYTFTNQESYQYYMLVINSTAGSGDFQLSEWRILQQ